MSFSAISVIFVTNLSMPRERLKIWSDLVPIRNVPLEMMCVPKQSMFPKGTCMQACAWPLGVGHSLEICAHIQPLFSEGPSWTLALFSRRTGHMLHVRTGTWNPVCSPTVTKQNSRYVPQHQVLLPPDTGTGNLMCSCTFTKKNSLHSQRCRSCWEHSSPSILNLKPLPCIEQCRQASFSQFLIWWLNPGVIVFSFHCDSVLSIEDQLLKGEIANHVELFSYFLQAWLNIKIFRIFTEDVGKNHPQELN